MTHSWETVQRGSCVKNEEDSFAVMETAGKICQPWGQKTLVEENGVGWPRTLESKEGAWDFILDFRGSLAGSFEQSDVMLWPAIQNDDSGVQIRKAKERAEDLAVSLQEPRQQIVLGVVGRAWILDISVLEQMRFVGGRI